MAIILEKISKDGDGVFKDAVSDRIFDLKKMKAELSQYYEDQKLFVKVDYPKNLTPEVKKAIDFYNQHEVELGQMAIANNIADARHLVNLMDQINLKEAP